MLFPLLCLIFTTKRKLINTAYLGIVLFILIMIGATKSSYFLIWLTGTAILFMPKSRRMHSTLAVGMAFLALCAAMPVRPLVSTGRLFVEEGQAILFIPDMIIGLATGLFIYSLLHSNLNLRLESSSKNKLSYKLPTLLSGFSFSLYVIHYPIINCVYFIGVKYGFKGLQPTIASVFIEIAFIILLCVLAYIFSRCTEAHTNKARRYLMEVINLLKGLHAKNFTSKNKQLH
jgi:peptidoglycan/LPS O-acetylase OafA/YrhL